MGRGSYSRELYREIERKNERLKRGRALLEKYKSYGYETALLSNGRAFYINKSKSTIYEFDYAAGKWREYTGDGTEL